MPAWAIVVWGALGIVAGVCLGPLTRWLLAPDSTMRTGVARVATITATGILFGLLAWRFPAWPEVLAYSCLAAVGVVLVVTDMIEHRLPSVVLAVGYLLIFVLFGLAAFLQDKDAAMTRGLIGMAAAFGAYFVLAIAARGGLGAGDVKLAGLLGFALGWLGWRALVAGMLVGFAYGAVIGVVMIALGKATRRTRVPFGPSMLAGAFTVLIGGGDL